MLWSVGLSGVGKKSGGVEARRNVVGSSCWFEKGNAWRPSQVICLVKYLS